MNYEQNKAFSALAKIQKQSFSAYELLNKDRQLL